MNKAIELEPENPGIYETKSAILDADEKIR